MKKILPLFIISVILFLSLNSYAYQDNTFYYQSDSSWNFERNGRGYCWVCCYAMIINNISDENVTPPDVAYVNSLHNDDPAMCYHHDIISTFGMEFEPAVAMDSIYFKDYEEYSGRTTLNATTEEDIKNALKEALNRNPEGILVRFEGNFVHTIVATHYDENYIYFSDPAFKDNASNIKFSETYNGKNGYSLTDIQFVQAIKDGKNQIDIFINSEKAELTDEPIIKKGRVMVPIRLISDYLDIEIEWTDRKKAIKAKKDGLTVEILIGQSCMYKEWKKIPLDVCPELINSKTYIPIKAIEDVFGYGIKWDEDKNAVYIDTISDVSLIEVW